MDLVIINDLIDELEQSDTSLSNVRNLSALYNVKTHLLGTEIYNNTIKELNDILPSYIDYLDIKRKYQLGEIQENVLFSYLESVCKEIREFIQILYSGTDTPKERDIIKNLIRQLTEAY